MEDRGVWCVFCVCVSVLKSYTGGFVLFKYGI